MSYRISPLWWPVLVVASPVLVPWLAVRNRRYRENRTRAAKINQERIQGAEPIELPALDFLELTVLVEWRAEEGFLGDAGVSYLFKSNLGSMLYDVGFGPTRPALSHNAARLDISLDEADSLTISHLHSDHMGGIPAQSARRVTLPEELMPSNGKVCYLPDHAEAPGFEAQVVQAPRMLTGGMATTGPLARSLFLFGYTEEQAVVARIKDRGLVVITGCGHPTIEVILKMVRRLSSEPIYVVGGGLHFPVTGGRGNRAGVQFQTVLGTGIPPWKRITDEDLSRTIAAINEAGPKKVLLSGHDTCDHALDRMGRELEAETLVLQAGATYRL